MNGSEVLGGHVPSPASDSDAEVPGALMLGSEAVEHLVSGGWREGVGVGSQMTSPC